jgi:radical SAM protein with 4Fe4S-binding SPASM domain
MMNKMLVAGWSLTNMCNLKCVHCYNASGKRMPDELTTTEALAVVKKLKKAGVVAVNFGGGECCLRPDFIRICSAIRKQGIKISYTTNGTTYSRIKNNLGLFDDIGVSIDFADAGVHDAFRGVPGTFNAAISTIKELVQKGVDTEIVTCLTKQNSPVRELQKMLDLCKSLKVNYWRLNRFRAHGRGFENKQLALSKDDLKNAFAFLAKHMHAKVSVPEPLFRAAYGGNYSISGDPSGNSAFRIQVNGNVTPSVFLDISGGNIKERAVAEIFSSPIFRRIRNRKALGKCRKCASYYHCSGGDAGASYLVYGHFNGPDPLCFLYPSMRRQEPVKCIPEKWNVHEMYLCTLYVPIHGDFA